MMLGTYGANTPARETAAQERAARIAAKRAETEARLAKLAAKERPYEYSLDQDDLD